MEDVGKQIAERWMKKRLSHQDLAELSDILRIKKTILPTTAKWFRFLIALLLHPAGRHFDFDNVAAVIAFEQCPEVVTVHSHAVRATEIDSFDIA